MILRQLPFARGHATILGPFYPRTHPGARRYKSHIALCRARLFTTTLTKDDDSSAAMLDECIIQADFFDRAEILPWAVGHLGRLQLHQLQSASLAATWQQQMEMLQALQSLGLLSDGQAFSYERNLRLSLVQSAVLNTSAKPVPSTEQPTTPKELTAPRVPNGQRQRRTIGARHNAHSLLRLGVRSGAALPQSER